MKRALALAVLFAIAATAAHGTEVVQAGPWDLHSSFWMSLHQTLMHDATRTDPRDVAALTAEEQTAWNEAVPARFARPRRSWA